ncbi:MAG TPA: hypothetical protein VN688_04420 [Gemmataceae bacterium]|nr:hypothetical protein [Gemmataceae bacterium]
MIFLAFFFPLAIYLLALGAINRRRRPLLVSGVWDGIGLLFGISGFLLFAGPAILSSFNERWRMTWLLGRDAPLATADRAWQFWIFLSLLYFALVVGGAALLLWRQRHLTAIYNVEVVQIEQALMQICQGLGLNPVHSGGLFLFGLTLGQSAERRDGKGERIQAPHYLPAALRAAGRESLEPLSPGSLAPDSTVLEQSAILELESFPLMRHVTLRWDPADSPLRQIVETELTHRLAETPTRESALGGWLLTCGFLLLVLGFTIAFALVVINMFVR